MHKFSNRQINRIQENVQRIADLVLFYETQSKESSDPVCASFLKNIADKKRIQLIVIERMVNHQGITILLTNNTLFTENSFSIAKLSEKSFEEIYYFICKQALYDLKLFTFLSIENHDLKPIFQAMFDLEEDFLGFVEADYLHQLSGCAEQNIREQSIESYRYTNAVA